MIDNLRYPPWQRRSGISFCVSLRNRLWQLEQTLAENLETLDGKHEICIADLGSDDGAVEWIWEHFSQQIQDGHLVFFQDVSSSTWNSSIAKNLAHRISRRSYLFNLDADNHVTAHDLKLIEAHAAAQIPCIQWSTEWGDGSYGRIGLPADVFFRIGGYDDAFLPMGGQDYDLLERLNEDGCAATLLDRPGRTAVVNDKAQSIKDVPKANAEGQAISYHDMNQINRLLSVGRRHLYGADIHRSFMTHVGYLNGELVCLDGFNRIHPAPGVAVAKLDEQRRPA